ncbi:VOC family protein [Sphingomonas sp. BN140010]|uniref:VOC family protein n=1 Tax=Sphingomonas arvum TaxID=2992113 RepID=A0ABT3JI86_9SPHN|nr:VOC family protein [Sphingomonas sp. BN140010]MCW3798691.1 VOC family protein [Sphingomonas sp. BN140010]
MQVMKGRLLDHVHLRVSDVAASRRFYEAVLGALGLAISGGDEGHFWSDELYVDQASDRLSSIHIAFQASDRAAVQRFHAAGVAAGGRDNGAPGERNYHPGYYGAFLIDPDGNNIEAVFHGPVKRSVDAVIIDRL